MNGLRALAIGIGGGKAGRQAVALAACYDRFIIQARTVGLTDDQAKAIVEDEVLRGGPYDTVFQRADRRLQLFMEYGYLPVTLREVLTKGELAAQPFAADVILNDWYEVSQPLGKRFAQMKREEQRMYVKRAINLARLGGYALVPTLATLLAQAYAPPPRLT